MILYIFEMNNILFGVVNLYNLLWFPFFQMDVDSCSPSQDHIHIPTSTFPFMTE